MNNAKKRRYVLTSEDSDYVENLITKNQAIVRSVLLSALGEKFDQIGEDCIGDLYLLTCEKINTIKNHENPDGWIVVATKNIALNAIRKHNNRLNNSTEKIIDIPVQDDVFERALFNIWIEEGVIDKLLSKLTPHEREVYDYLYQKRLTYKKVSEIMGISESTLRNTNAKIRKKIQNQIKLNNF